MRFNNKRSVWTKLGSKQAFFFLQLQLFPLRQTHKVVFGDPEHREEVCVTEVFLTKKKATRFKENHQKGNKMPKIAFSYLTSKVIMVPCLQQDKNHENGTEM